MIKFSTMLLFLFLLALPAASARTGERISKNVNSLQSEVSRFFQHKSTEKPNADCVDPVGTKWAVLIAGSNGYENYRHQADVCHAYQIMKKGGLKDENIIVFMYDDIAYNEANPRPGVIINSPNGTDVYQGVPKDYIGVDVNSNNFYAVLLGIKSALTGGSGKVLESGLNDNVFIYYVDHGDAGILGMPSDDDLIYANDLADVLKSMYFSGTYNRLVFYVESCESGSMFDGLLPEESGIYAVTASKPDESSYAYYCPEMIHGAPLEYDTCLGDLFSISWLEDCDCHHMNGETLQEQYRRVSSRTKRGNPRTGNPGSHVMRYGHVLDLMFNNVSEFMGMIPVDDSSVIEANASPKLANQHDAELIHFWTKFHRAPEGTSKKLEAHNRLREVISHRNRVDKSVKRLGEALFGSEKGLESVRPAGQPLVDDWDCLKSMVNTYETQCGPLSRYGRRHMRAFANICNAGIGKDQMAEASAKACSKETTQS